MAWDDTKIRGFSARTIHSETLCVITKTSRITDIKIS